MQHRDIEGILPSENIKITRSKLIINAVIFQVLWFICVQGNNLTALLATAAGVAIHWTFYSRRLTEWALVIVFLTVGIIWESIVASNALIHFSGGMLLGSSKSPMMIAPLWLTCLWIAFAMTLRHSMAWLARSTVLRTLLCLLFVPLSYYAGAIFSGSTFPSGITAGLLSEALTWCLLLHMVYRK